jgi:hypothetical protein
MTATVARQPTKSCYFYGEARRTGSKDDLLLEEYAGWIYLQTFHTVGSLTKRLTNILVQVTKISQQSLRREPFDPHAVISAAIFKAVTMGLKTPIAQRNCQPQLSASLTVLHCRKFPKAW